MATKPTKRKTQSEKIEEAQENVLQMTQALLVETRRTFGALQTAAHFAFRLREDGTVPVLFRDTIVNIALPFADFDRYQMTMLTSRKPAEDSFLAQLTDLIPSLKGFNIIDVGSFTGSTGIFLHKLLEAKKTHLFEPQKVMQDALKATINANPDIKGLELHNDVIDEDGHDILLGTTRNEKLSETKYIRHDRGPLKSKSIDSFKFTKVGLINMDFSAPKIYALRGAEKTIAKHRPILCIDRSARDIDETKEFLEPFDYKFVPTNGMMMIYLPK